jgi:hypothetical protein
MQRSEGSWTGPDYCLVPWNELVAQYKATHEAPGSDHALEGEKDDASTNEKDAPIDVKAEKPDDSEFEEYFTSKSSN